MKLSDETLYRNKLITDILDGVIPDRVPIAQNWSVETVIEAAGFDLGSTQYDTKKIVEAIDHFLPMTENDINGVSVVRFPAVYDMLGSRNYRMSTEGFLQHPNVVGMEIEDYDAFIADPMRTIEDVIIPRLHPNTKGNKGLRNRAIGKWLYSTMRIMMASNKLSIKHNKATLGFASGISVAPMDFISDNLRSFDQILIDIKRRPQKVIDAADAITPYIIQMGAQKGPNGTKHDVVTFPLHMPPYMSLKDFEKCWWPSMKVVVDSLDAMGYVSSLVLESDFSRFIDHLQELPAGTQFMVELGDPKIFKEKLSGKVLTGFFPISLARYGTTDECVAETKRLLDILAPGGKYYFSFDLPVISFHDFKLENVSAIYKTVQEYGKY